MSAANTDLVRNAAPNFATTLSGAMLNTDTSLTLSSATGLPTATAITLVIDATDPTTGASTPTLKEVVTGTLSGTTVSNLLRGQDSTSAIGHASGANVVMWITANLWNDFQTAFLHDHKQLGYHGDLTDANGNAWIKQTATTSAVNQITVANAATGSAPKISATGTDTNIDINLTPKGTGRVALNGAGAAAGSSVATTETTGSTSYVALTTADTCTVTVGNSGVVLLSISVQSFNSGTGICLAAYDISGANTTAASDTTIMAYTTGTAEVGSSGTILLSGLTAGSTTFKIKYRVNSGTGTWERRKIVAVPLG